MRPAFEEAKKKFGQDAICVEVGVASGDNAINVLSEWNPKCLFLVDSYPAYGDRTEASQSFTKEFAASRFINHPNYIWVYKDSVDASKEFTDESIDFIYIDANHSYASVESDILAWFRKVRVGGIIAGHDFDSSEDNYGVARAVFLWATINHHRFTVDNSDWWVVK